MRAGRGVAMVLRNVQGCTVAAHLHIERQLRLEAVLPVDREPEKAEIELPRLRLIEAAKDGDGSHMLERHSREPDPRSARAARTAARAKGRRRRARARVLVTEIDAAFGE